MKGPSELVTGGSVGLEVRWFRKQVAAVFLIHPAELRAKYEKTIHFFYTTAATYQATSRWVISGEIQQV
jgi:hypothetical protein